MIRVEFWGYYSTLIIGNFKEEYWSPGVLGFGCGVQFGVMGQGFSVSSAKMGRSLDYIRLECLEFRDFRFGNCEA